MRLARRSALARSAAVKMRARKRSPCRSMRLADAPHVDDVGADADDHSAHLVRPRSMAARMNFTVSAKPLEHRFADQEMADIELDDLRQRRDRLRAGVVEAVAGMDFEAEAFRQRGAVADQLPFGARLRRVLFGERVAPGAGVQLDHRRAQSPPPPRSARLRADEQRNADAGVFELLHRRVRAARAGRRRRDRLRWCARCAFPAPGRRHAACLERDGDHLLGRRHLEIKRLGDFRLEPGDVVVADVAAILAQMRGDAVGARRDGELGRAHRVGMAPAARVADGGDVVDIDAEA